MSYAQFRYKPPGFTSKARWWSQYFIKHPEYATRSSAAYYGNGFTARKARVFCESCIAHRAEEIRHEEQHALQRGEMRSVRELSAIRGEGKLHTFYA